MKQVKWSLITACAIICHAQAALEPDILEGEKLEEPTPKCPDALVKPYHLYGRAQIGGAYIGMPEFEYGLETGNAKRFKHSPTTIGANGQLALGWRSTENQFLPVMFGDRAKYEASINAINTHESTSLDGSTMQVFPLNRGSSTSVTLNQTPKLDSEARWFNLQLLIKANPGQFRPVIGLDAQRNKDNYKIKQVNSTNGNPFSLDEEVTSMYVGPLVGFDYRYPYDNYSFDIGTRISAYYFESDLDAKQQLSGSTNTVNDVSDSGFSAKAMIHADGKYHFKYGNVGLFANFQDNPFYSSIDNPQNSNTRIKLDTDNVMYSTFGLKLSLHGSKSVNKPRGRCLEI